VLWGSRSQESLFDICTKEERDKGGRSDLERTRPSDGGGDLRGARLIRQHRRGEEFFNRTIYDMDVTFLDFSRLGIGQVGPGLYQQSGEPDVNVETDKLERTFLAKWVLVTSGACILALPAPFILASICPPFPGGGNLTIAAIVGCAQWFMLRERLAISGWWVLACAIWWQSGQDP